MGIQCPHFLLETRGLLQHGNAGWEAIGERHTELPIRTPIRRVEPPDEAIEEVPTDVDAALSSDGEVCRLILVVLHAFPEHAQASVVSV